MRRSVAAALLLSLLAAASATAPAASGLEQLQLGEPPPLLLAQRGRRRGRALAADGELAGDGSSAGVAITTGAVATAGCFNKQPINQLHHRHATASDSGSDIIGLWLGGWSDNDNTQSDGWGPGTDGAACAIPPKWGKPYLTMRPKCVKGTTGATATDWYYQLYNSWAPPGQPGAGAWMEVVTRLVAYSVPGSDDPLQRLEITTDLWSPDPAPLGTWARSPLTNAIGRAPANLRPGTEGVSFMAPAGKVLSDVTAACFKAPGAAASVVTALTSACAMEPLWHPKPFANRAAALAAGYTCSAV